MKFSKWHIAPAEEADIRRLGEAGYPQLVSQVLAARGISTAEEAAAFLERGRDLTCSPFLMKDMDRAVECISRAISQGRRMAVFGDYDVDGITATVILADNTTHTGTKRLGPEEIDLAELDRLNTLSRRLCRGETVDWTVTKRRIYSRRTRLLCTFLATAAFCIYFGGTWAEAVLCGGFGILVSGYRPALQSGFTAVLLDATVAGLLAFTPQALGLPLRGANILIGTIMLLVPGLTVGNALRDMIDGDLLAGLLQLAEAVLCALAIALGCAFALWLPGSVGR